MDIRVYGKILNRWHATVEHNGHEYEKIVQIEVAYKEYDAETMELVRTGSEDFSMERWNSEVEDAWIWTWDGQKRNRGGHRMFDGHGDTCFRKSEKKAYKKFLQTKYNAVTVELR